MMILQQLSSAPPSGLKTVGFEYRKFPVACVNVFMQAYTGEILSTRTNSIRINHKMQNQSSTFSLADRKMKDGIFYRPVVELLARHLQVMSYGFSTSLPPTRLTGYVWEERQVKCKEKNHEGIISVTTCFKIMVEKRSDTEFQFCHKEKKMSEAVLPVGCLLVSLWPLQPSE